jgi:putative transposase
VSYEYGIHANQLYRWKAQVIERWPSLLENEQKTAKAEEIVHEHQIQELYAEIGKLSTHMVEREDSDLPLSAQAELLSLNRRNLYYQPVGPSTQEITAKHRIDDIYTAHPYYGSRRITAVLRKEMVISRPTAQHYMREMGLARICPGLNLSKRRREHKTYPYLLRNLLIDQPKEAFCVALTITTSVQPPSYA